MNQPDTDELEKLIAQQLTQMRTQYTKMSTDVLGKIDALNNKIDTLQNNIALLLEHAEMDKAALEQHQQWAAEGESGEQEQQ
eukprot:UN00309